MGGRFRFGPFSVAWVGWVGYSFVTWGVLVSVSLACTKEISLFMPVWCKHNSLEIYQDSISLKNNIVATWPNCDFFFFFSKHQKDHTMESWLYIITITAIAKYHYTLNIWNELNKMHSKQLNINLITHTHILASQHSSTQPKPIISYIQTIEYKLQIRHAARMTETWKDSANSLVMFEGCL